MHFSLIRPNTLLACAYMWIFAVAHLHAELPPAAYAKLRAQSPEALTIQTLTVSTNGADITARAKVLSVQRTSSGLKTGSLIQIRYSSFKSSMPGPGPAMVLKQGAHYHAWLSKGASDDFYGLAAQGSSFEVVVANLLPQWRGQQEGEADLSTRVLKTQKGWSSFWSHLNRPEPQALNQDREMAVFIALGETPTGGFKPEILSAAERDGKYEIVYTVGAPPPETIVTQMICHPWVIAIVPKSVLPVEARNKR